ncbi:MAG: DNA (cytosine-5-)-methyltransferase [Myxococcales bacterium]
MSTGPATARGELRAVDLFSGCGGLTLGLKRAGFKVIAAVECEDGAVEAYILNHPDVAKVYAQDIREVSGKQILDDAGLAVGELDLLAGCPPCQGFSRVNTLNGKRGEDDSRNDLVYQYLRLVEELNPLALLMENVPALMQDARYATLRARVSELGYHVSDEVHDAAEYGVPQRRRRLIMLAAKNASPLIPDKVPQNARTTVRTAIASLSESAGTSGDPAHDVAAKRQPHVEDLIRRIPHDGGSRKDLGAEAQLECHRRCDGFFDVYGRMKWDDVSPTITSGFPSPSKGRFLHPTEDRTITPREAGLLQTFPDDYKFPMRLGKYPVAQMIGNALPPRLAEVHASAIAEVLRAPRQ